MEVTLFNRNLTTPVREAALTKRVQGMRFSTRLPGGFGICKFRLLDDYWRAYQFMTGKQLYRLVVTDYNADPTVKRVLFEGRIEDISLDYGAIEVTAYGYMVNLGDRPYRTAYNDTADAVMKAMLTALCSQINSDQSNIDATDITITSGADASYLDETPIAIMGKLLDFSDSTGAKWDWAIWEDRKAYLKKRSPTAVDWYVSLKDFNRFRLSHRVGDLWTRSYGLYQAGGSLTRTADYTDATTESKYGDGTNGFVREYPVPDMGAVAATAAEAARTAWVEAHKLVKPAFDDAVLGAWVYDAKGVRYPSSWVRAGQVLKVKDLVPATESLDAVALDAVKTFFIVETEYDAERRENRLVFDTESGSLDAVLARKV